MRFAAHLAARFAALPAGLRGAAWMILAGLAYTALAILVRYSSDDFSPFEMLLFRAVVTVVVLAPVILRQGRAALRPRSWWLQFARAGFTYLAMLALFFAVPLVPLATVVALQFTLPLFIILFAAILLRERIGRMRAIATALGFAGVLIIVRPGLIEIGIGTLALLFSSLSYAGSNIAIKVVVRTDSPEGSVVVGNLLMAALAVVPAIFFWKTPDLGQLMLLLAIGLTGTMSIVCLTRAYSVADASAVTPYDFVRLPVAAVLGWLLFSETVDMWTWIGACVIFAGGYMLARSEGRKPREHKAAG